MTGLLHQLLSLNYAKIHHFIHLKESMTEETCFKIQRSIYTISIKIQSASFTGTLFKRFPYVPWQKFFLG